MGVNLRRTAAVVLSAACLVLGVSACGDDEGGDATPGGTTASTPAGEQPGESAGGNEEKLPAYGAPKVESPIEDTKSFQDDPCSTLTDADVEKFLGSAPEGEKDKGEGGPRCRWASEHRVIVQWITATGQGLSGDYQRKSEFASFEPLEVDGMPAVAAKQEATKEYGCDVSVGVTDQLQYVASAMLDEGAKTDPCKAAEEVAKAVLANIKKGSS